MAARASAGAPTGDSRAADRSYDQAVKLRARVAVDPTDVRAALGARRHLPRPARKPRERGLRRAEMRTAGCRVEATDAVVEPGRIDERVLVRAGHLDPVIVV